ncbi:MAG: DNA translocase FtsK 4TM domain-containing protein [Candidatus Aminicenantes bacterium]|nr:DNA translocase FtsK 4TM domain-containing protein [Candidatus Aminicenantes bacterium]
MVKHRSTKGPEPELTLRNEVLGIIFLFLSVFLIFSVFSYSPVDPSFFHSTMRESISNYGGRLGAQLAAVLFNLLGYAAYGVVFYLLMVTVHFFLNRGIARMGTKSAGYLLLVLAASGFVTCLHPQTVIDGMPIHTGGMIGFFLNRFFRVELKPFFACGLFLVFMLVALVVIAKVSLRRLLQSVWELLKVFGKWLREAWKVFQKRRSARRVQAKYRRETQVPSGRAKVPSSKEKAGPAPKAAETRRIAREPSRLPEESFLFADEETGLMQSSAYTAPPLTYLDAVTEQSQIDFKELDRKRDELTAALEEFRIQGNIREYTPGPVITTYEFEPDSGVKVKDVTNLSEDLALAVKAQYVRIERILGKRAIGIEIPNRKREIIHLREILESEEYRRSSSPLTLALGKTKSGEIFITDLREMPHLIVAGATGSGKSVAIHSIILSILYKAPPTDVKFVLIDPKRVELAIYNRLPHLLTPVVVNNKLAKNALDWAVWEMEQRYQKIAKLQVRNIDQYNKKLDLLIQSGDELLERLEDTERIPYVVIIIDEFADLMLESSREIEDDVARIAQKARAVGIHLILATQRPSTDVITGTIKNNFPSRIAMAVPSKFDSRTIVDVMGAEKLLGNGDMLFLPPKTASLIRLHGAYVSEEEAMRVINFLAKKEKPRYDTQVIKPRSATTGGAGEGDLDELFNEAAAIVIETGQASASFLQRRMRIGYARAGRLIDQLEAKEVVSPPNSRSQRDVLMSMSDLENLNVTEDDLED